MVSSLSLKCGFAVTAPDVSADFAERLFAGQIELAMSPAGALSTVGAAFSKTQVTSDNVQPFYRQAFYTDLPTTFIVETNSSCNYHCLMCPYHGGRQNHKPTFIKPGAYVDMDYDVFKRVVDEIAALPRPHQGDVTAMVSPYRRGEFLLYAHWREAIAYIKANGLRGYFSSNGSRWTQDDVDYIVDSGLDQIQISIEGHDPDSHKKIRLNNEYEKVANTVRMIMATKRDKGVATPLLQLAHTVNERNYDLVPEYVEHWLNKVDALFIGPENFADDEFNNKGYKPASPPCLCRIGKSGPLVR